MCPSHDLPAAHRLLQLPQLLLSSWRFTHTPLQRRVSPGPGHGAFEVEVEVARSFDLVSKSDAL
jgi:hypothetical protein